MTHFSTLQELFADESRWIQKAYARSKHNRKTRIHSKRAVKWCLLGGVNKIYYRNNLEEIQRRIHIYIIQKGYYNILDFNDNPHTTITDIQKLVADLNV